MTDTATATETTKEKTMTDTATETNGKTKTKKATKAKAANGAAPVLAKLEKLPRGMTRSVQETFRATPEEHNQLVAEASKGNFGSMSDFYRDKLGLD